MSRFLSWGRRPPEPPRKRLAFSVYGGPVEVAGSPAEAEALGKLFTLDENLERGLTHGFHSYAGRLHPSIARGAIGRFSPPGAVVLDPFCGSGTVLVEALVAGRTGVGIDASPLGVMIAEVRSSPLGEGGRAELVQAAAEIAHESGERARKRQRPKVPRWAAPEFERFAPHVAFELLGLRELVLATAAHHPIGKALRLCLSSLLVKFMQKGPAAPRDGLEKRIARGAASRLFGRRAEELVRGLAELELVTPPGTAPASVMLGDARAYPRIPPRAVDLVLSSPPYAGIYDYAEHHAVRFRWLGLDTDQFRKRQLGERASAEGAQARQWREGRQRWLAEMGRVLRPGGSVVLVVGDGVVEGRPEDASTAIEDEAASANLVPMARASQARAPRNAKLRALFGSTPRCEHILLLKRS